MRIIAGRWKGHRLVSFQAQHVRPTTDRIKESIFNSLQSQLESARVLDLFSGTGSLGLEALSRGASRVTFVENHRKSVAILKKNIARLKVSPSEYDVALLDVFKFLDEADLSAFDLIFVDPPFTQKWAHASMEAMSNHSEMSLGSQVVIESSRHEQIDEEYDNFRRLKCRDFGDKKVSIFERFNLRERECV